MWGPLVVYADKYASSFIGWLENGICYDADGKGDN